MHSLQESPGDVSPNTSVAGILVKLGSLQEILEVVEQ